MAISWARQMTDSQIIALVAIAISLLSTGLIFLAHLTLSSDLRTLEDSISMNARETDSRIAQFEKALDEAEEHQIEMRDELSSLRDTDKELLNDNLLLRQKIESLILANENLASEIVSLNAEIASLKQRILLLEGDDHPPQARSIEPVAEWTFDESQNIGRDASGNDNDGTLNGVPEWVGANNCRMNGCLIFDGSDDFISVRDSVSLDLADQGTITAWIKLGDSRNQWGPIVSKRISGDAPGFSYELDLSPSGSNLRGIISNGLTYDEVIGDTSLDSDRWYHLAFTWDSVTLRIYVDGNLDGSTSQRIDAFQNSYPVEIGRGDEHTSTIFSYKGYLDDIRIYNRALSDEEIRMMG
ncbi:MAG: hypothetical protein MN733_26860 [Nitrososphaera sp.]|nr:hypothetical protein [Nitrososphaera sp.]